MQGRVIGSDETTTTSETGRSGVVQRDAGDIKPAIFQRLAQSYIRPLEMTQRPERISSIRESVRLVPQCLGGLHRERAPRRHDARERHDGHQRRIRSER